MKKLFFALVAVVCLASASAVSAQNQKPLKFHGNPDYYLEVQGEHIFKAVDEGLDAYPPVVGDDIARRLTLYNLDALLHDTRHDNSVAFCAFVESRLAKLIKDLNTPFKKGLRVYKIYNDAFIARTASVNVAFDISRCRCRGHEDHIVSNENIVEIVKHCDVLFLSHNHGDHVDRFVVNQFIAAGKPVIAAPDILMGVQGVTHYRNEEAPQDVEVALKSGQKLQVRIYPGHQSNMMNNVYAVTTPEKYTVCHTGDQHNKQDMEWIANVKNHSPRIDALMINCWTRNLTKAIEGFNPHYVLTGHENEMGHTIDHRESFWLTFKKIAPTKYPYVVMAWGEWFTIK